VSAPAAEHPARAALHPSLRRGILAGIPAPSPAETFEANLALIERVAGSVCRRAGIFGADAEDFVSGVRVALMENDYATLRLYEGRSSLGTFLTVVIQRFLIDERIRKGGRWRPSREAERLGEAGIVLERIVRRERRTLEEALPIVRGIDPSVTLERLAGMERRLPPRLGPVQLVELDASEEQLAAAGSADDRLLAAQQQRLSERVAEVVRATLEGMPLEDRMIVRFHFGQSMTIADIAGLLRLPQRPLYRRLEALLQRFRAALAKAGVGSGDVRDLVGDVTRELDFALREGKRDALRQTHTPETQ
jgi:RNA polymerase sigma factor (sigma-70 family)